MPTICCERFRMSARCFSSESKPRRASSSASVKSGSSATGLSATGSFTTDALRPRNATARGYSAAHVR